MIIGTSSLITYTGYPFLNTDGVTVGDKHCYFCQFQFSGSKCPGCSAYSNFKKSSAARRIPSTDEKPKKKE